MKKSLRKAFFTSALCLGIAGFGIPSAIHANTDTASIGAGSYGTLYGSNHFYNEAGSPPAKRVDLDASIGASVSYVGVKLSVKNYNTGSNYYTSSNLGRSGRSYHADWDFLKQEYPSVYNNTSSAFGTHEIRDSYSYAVYTATYD